MGLGFFPLEEGEAPRERTVRDSIENGVILGFITCGV
jgi:hypothetical protein